MTAKVTPQTRVIERSELVSIRILLMHMDRVSQSEKEGTVCSIYAHARVHMVHDQKKADERRPRPSKIP